MLGRLRTTRLGAGPFNRIQAVHIFLLSIIGTTDFIPLGHRMVATHVNHIYIPGRNPGKGMNDSQDLPLVTLSFTQGETSPETFFDIWPHQLFIVARPRKSNTYLAPLCFWNRDGEGGGSWSTVWWFDSEMVPTGSCSLHLFRAGSTVLGGCRVFRRQGLVGRGGSKKTHP